MIWKPEVGERVQSLVSYDPFFRGQILEVDEVLGGDSYCLRGHNYLRHCEGEDLKIVRWCAFMLHEIRRAPERYRESPFEEYGEYLWALKLRDKGLKTLEIKPVIEV